MALDTHEQVNAWLREQATEAAGVMIMCAPADIAGGDPRAKGAFESVATDAIDGLTKDPVTFHTACGGAGGRAIRGRYPGSRPRPAARRPAGASLGGDPHGAEPGRHRQRR